MSITGGREGVKNKRHSQSRQHNEAVVNELLVGQDGRSLCGIVIREQFHGQGLHVLFVQKRRLSGLMPHCHLAKQNKQHCHLAKQNKQHCHLPKQNKQHCHLAKQNRHLYTHNLDMHTYTAGIKEDFKQRVWANAGSSVSVKVTSPVDVRHS